MGNALDGRGIKRKLLKKHEIKNVREKLIKEQNGVCPVCQREFSEKITPCLDHDHDTYLVRGVLCSQCNSIEGYIKQKMKRMGLGKIDYIMFLENLVTYLKQEQLPLIHPMHTPKNKKLQKRSYNTLVKKIENVNEHLQKKIKIPPYPKSGRLTKRLKELFNQFNITPQFYKK